MDKINAKEELLEKVNSNNLRILVINCKYGDEIRGKDIKALDELDFEYDNDYGSQELYGEVYCVDSLGNPVWLTRGEYDGSEWWDVNCVPDFYKSKDYDKLK